MTPLEPLPPTLNEAETRAVSDIVWEALYAHLERTTIRENLPHTGELGVPRAVFVTLYTQGELRGCIGTTLPRLPLAEAVAEKTVAAASSDPRFPPLTSRELTDLEIDVSVLSSLVLLTGGPSELVRGVHPGYHGLCVELGLARGLLLPQVCRKYRWTAEEFLCQTALKADLDREAWRDRDANVYVFSALTFRARRPEGPS